MRTRAQAKEAAAAGEADAPAQKRRGRARTELAQADTTGDDLVAEPQSITVTAVRMVGLDEGLYALRVGEIDGTADEVAGMTVPAAQVGAPFAEDGNGVEIVASFPGRGPMLRRRYRRTRCAARRWMHGRRSSGPFRTASGRCLSNSLPNISRRCARRRRWSAATRR